MIKKTFKKALSVVLAAAIFMVAGNMSDNTAQTAKKAAVSVKTFQLNKGQKKTIKIKNKRKNAKYTFKSSSKKVAKVNAKGVVTAVGIGTAKITVKESVKISGKKRNRNVGTVKVKVGNKKNKQADTDNPAVNVQPSNVPVPVITPTPLPDVPDTTPVPTPTSSPDVYTKEIFSVNVSETRIESVEGSTCKVDMHYFNGEASGEYFNGNVYKESSNVRKTYRDGRVTSCARYILKGKDDAGNECMIFIQDDGVMNDGVTVTKPLILTDSKSLEWIEKADIQGRIVADENGDTVIKYMWNESNEEDVLPTEPVRPDTTKDYTKEIFTFYIDIGASDTVNGNGGSATMIHFMGRGECDNFNGNVVADSVDTRLKFPGMVESLSARYILEGTDATGNPCRVYVENNGIDDNGMVTEPLIITDSPDYAWVETAPLHGTVSWEKGLTIHMWTVDN